MNLNLNQKLLRNVFFLLAMCVFPSLGHAQLRLVEVWKLDQGLDRPESVVYDAARDVLYVSSIGGAPAEKDGNGYLSRVSPEGKMLEQKWVTGGMHAPKGLTLSNGRLYAADLDALIEINPESGEIIARYPVKDGGESFLNDVTADTDGTVYVSDSRTSRLYRLHEGTFDVWVEDPNIRNPNGVHVVDGQLIVAAGDEKAENPGAARYLQVVDLKSRAIKPLKDRTPLGGTDAVEPDGKGGLFLSDWAAGKVMHFSAEGQVTVLKELGPGTADLDYVDEQKIVYLPIMMSDELVAYRVEH